jgi:hypothetical protein
MDIQLIHNNSEIYTNFRTCEYLAAVVFSRTKVTIHPAEKVMPEFGEGLHREAIVTLEKAWPVHPLTKRVLRNPKEHVAEFEAQERALREASTSQLTRFMSYEPEIGRWTFRVRPQLNY